MDAGSKFFEGKGGLSAGVFVFLVSLSRLGSYAD